MKWEGTLVYTMYTPTSSFPVLLTHRGHCDDRAGRRGAARDMSCAREEEEIGREAGVEDRDRDRDRVIME